MITSSRAAAAAGGRGSGHLGPVPWPPRLAANSPQRICMFPRPPPSPLRLRAGSLFHADAVGRGFGGRRDRTRHRPRKSGCRRGMRPTVSCGPAVGGIGISGPWETLLEPKATGLTPWESSPRHRNLDRPALRVRAAPSAFYAGHQRHRNGTDLSLGHVAGGSRAFEAPRIRTFGTRTRSFRSPACSSRRQGARTPDHAPTGTYRYSRLPLASGEERVDDTTT